MLKQGDGIRHLNIHFTKDYVLKGSGEEPITN